MKPVIAIILLFIPLILNDCEDDGVVCSTANKDVTVINNTGFDLEIHQVGPFGFLTLGPLGSFERKTYKFPPDFVIRAVSPAGGFSRELYITQCKQNWELIVEQ